MKATVVSAVLGVNALLVGLCGNTVRAQEETQVPGLSSGWSQLPAADFVSRVKVLEEQGPLSDEAATAVHRHAAELLDGYDFMQVSTAEYPTLDGLHEMATGWVQHELGKRIHTAMATRVDDWTERPYDEIRGKVAMQFRVKLPFKAYASARRWIADGGTLADIESSEIGQQDMKDPYAPLAMKLLFADASLVLGDFSVTWEGRLIPSQSGVYTFSVSPINVNAIDGGYYVKQSMSVTLGGQVVISATPEQWNAESVAYQLTAGQVIPLKVQMSVDSSELPEGVLHALLMWTGPSGEREIIPKENLMLPAAGTQGLRATYEWEDGGRQKSATRTDKTIDFVWPRGGLIVAGNSVVEDEAAATVSSIIWTRGTDTDALDLLEASGEMHPLMVNPETSAMNLSSSQRKAFHRLLLRRPVLVDPVAPLEFAEFYRAYRMGAEEEALDVFGLWASRSTNDLPEMGEHDSVVYIDMDMRQCGREMATCVTQELPDHLTRLQDLHLQLSDGTCSLPVAYTLAYGYQSIGRLNDYIALLESYLDNPSVTGDLRVNWLIARAHAQEIRLGPKEPRVVIRERLLDGRGWLDEARLSAVSPLQKVRAGLEVATRLTAVGEFDEARAVFQSIESLVPAEVTDQFAELRQSVDRFESSRASREVAQAAAAKTSYLEAIQKRRDRAAAAGNQAAVDRYDALIEAASSQ